MLAWSCSSLCAGATAWAEFPSLRVGMETLGVLIMTLLGITILVARSIEVAQAWRAAKEGT